jgi:hypothetical protein
MLANKENRAPLKTRIFFSVFTAVFVTLFLTIYDYYQDRVFNILSVLGNLIYYSVVMFIVSYFFLKLKKPQEGKSK